MNESASSKRILLTGVSSGIGHGLAGYYLDKGAELFGMSRRMPGDLASETGFRFESVDLSVADQIDEALGRLIGGVSKLDLVILNAGVLGQLGDLLDSSVTDLTRTMQVNVWANVAVLNGIFSRGIRVEQVVAISSGASVNGNRGLSGYSISKAALNMLVKLYSREQPDTHFCAFAPGLVETGMQDTLCGREPDQRYPAFEILRERRNTPEMPLAGDAAPQLAAAIQRLPELVDSGDYADIRQLPTA